MRDGIGLLGEKWQHQIIKRYLTEDPGEHEVKLAGTRFVSDVRVGNAIYEVQTGSFAPMKKKLERMWYYYKWYILAAALVLLVAANFVGELGQRRQPDGVVSIVTTSQVPEETVEEIRALFETLWGDRNQDGVTDVEVNVYAYDGMGYSGGSADDYAAAAVHLASEIQAGTTDLFLSDAEELMRQAERLQYYGAFREYDALHRLDCAELEDFGVYAFPEKAALLDMLR